eukprot:jgi/Antlo1/1420/1387
MGDNEGGNQGDNGNKTKKILMIIFTILAIVIISIIIISIWKSSTNSGSGGESGESKSGDKDKSKGEEKLIEHRYSSDESSRRLKASDLRGQDADFRSNLASSGMGRVAA